MFLHEGKVGAEYRIVKLHCAGNQKRRFHDLGFIKSTKILVENIAPLGATILVSLFGYKLALRKQAAQLIEIETER